MLKKVWNLSDQLLSDEVFLISTIAIIRLGSLALSIFFFNRSLLKIKRGWIEEDQKKMSAGVSSLVFGVFFFILFFKAGEVI